MPSLPLAAMTVLVADDDDDMRLYIRGCLYAFGAAQVLEVTDGNAALGLAPIADLVVTDALMPGLDGLSLCRALKSDARTREIPVLLVSGETTRPAPCADGFLEKPFNASRLRDEIERLLARPV